MHNDAMSCLGYYELCSVMRTKIEEDRYISRANKSTQSILFSLRRVFPSVAWHERVLHEILNCHLLRLGGNFVHPKVKAVSLHGPARGPTLDRDLPLQLFRII